MSSDFNNPLRKFKLVFLGEQSGSVLGFFSREEGKSFSIEILVTIPGGRGAFEWKIAERIDTVFISF